jgi:hypothetical protein
VDHHAADLAFVAPKNEDQRSAVSFYATTPRAPATGDDRNRREKAILGHENQGGARFRSDHA